ncbi:metal ABC transporter ATP-binding protein [Sphaerochaeta sp. PS]|uniref:metal ABC transporter ATP-binding protein n=1 Tax=Sphaerochaeta sp. PS TaxID=3076336 RepID=UPI0028A3B79E|nr:metal ABC transporter ATP-binding protein [Sphaerochaeta sp. PS]MDT4761010.1 metal ABC transporter ATP-binding protein [Sphaerochaeta sp. PS]
MSDVPIALRFSHVAFSYEALSVLEDVNFHIHAGEFSALVGPNGSGKTTILKLILGLEQSQKGEVLLFGDAPRKNRSMIGYVPQHITYDPTFPISVLEVVRMGGLLSISRKGRLERDTAAYAALEQVELRDLAQRPYSELSGGQRRRVLVARALVAGPKMLILDEPTANMDAESEKRLFDTLRFFKGKTTILIVTHDMSTVSSLTDRVFCIGAQKPGQKGRTVVQHSLEPLLNSPTELYGGSALRVLHDVELPADYCTFDGGPNNG